MHPHLNEGMEFEPTNLCTEVTSSRTTKKAILVCLLLTISAKLGNDLKEQCTSIQYYNVHLNIYLETLFVCLLVYVSM